MLRHPVHVLVWKEGRGYTCYGLGGRAGLYMFWSGREVIGYTRSSLGGRVGLYTFWSGKGGGVIRSGQGGR